MNSACEEKPKHKRIKYAIQNILYLFYCSQVEGTNSSEHSLKNTDTRDMRKSSGSKPNQATLKDVFMCI